MQNWIVDIIQTLGSFGVGLLMLLENVFPPIPSELIMPLAGFLSARDAMSFSGAVAVGSLGSLAGTCLWYLLGRRIGEQRLRRWIEAHGIWLAMRPTDVDRAQRFFARHGGKSVIFGRLLPVVPTLISVPAGLTGMPLPAFLLYSALGTVLWTAALAYAGRLLGLAYPQIGDVVGWVSWGILALVLVSYIWRVLRLRREQR